MFLLPDGTFYVQLINFAIFFAILNFVFLRPVGKGIAQRRTYIDSLTEAYDKTQAEATRLRQDAEEARAAARREADSVLAKARAEASNEAADIARSTEERIRAITDDATRTVDAEVAALASQQAALAKDLAQSMVARIFAETA